MQKAPSGVFCALEAGRVDEPMNGNRLTPTTFRPPLSWFDLHVNRIAGVVIILVGLAIAYSLIFTAFDQRVQFQWELNNEGARVPITHVTCPSPWSVVVDGTQPGGVVSGDLCVLPARGALIQGVVVVVVTLALGVWVYTRTYRPAPMPMLPPSVRALLRRK